MTIRETIAEALLNLRAHFLLSSSTFLASFLLTFVALIGSLLEVSSILDRQDLLRDRGLGVMLVTPLPGENDLDASRCHALNSHGAIKSAGAIMETVEAYTLGKVPVLVSYATPRLADVFWPGLAASSTTVVGQQVALTHGVERSGNWALSENGTQTSFPIVIAPTTERDSNWNRAVLVPRVPQGNVRSCWVEAHPGHDDGIESLLSSWWPGVQVSISPLLTLGPTSLSPETEIDTRVSSWFALASGLLACAVLTMAWVVRKSEFALYRLLGLRKRGLLVVFAVDTLSLAITPAILALSLTSTLLVHIGVRWVSAQTLAIDGTTTVVFLFVCPIFGYALAARNVVDRLKNG